MCNEGKGPEEGHFQPCDSLMNTVAEMWFSCLQSPGPHLVREAEGVERIYSEAAQGGPVAGSVAAGLSCRVDHSDRQRVLDEGEGRVA